MTRWAKSFQWTDASRDPASNAVNNAAQYTLSGLPASTRYNVYTNGALLYTGTNSGGSGTLNLTNISLQPSATVLVGLPAAGTIALLR